MDTKHTTKWGTLVPLALILVLGLSGCSPSGPALTDDVILSELHNHSYSNWYPQQSPPLIYNLGPNDPLAAECRKLIDDHFAEFTDGTMGWYHPTEKGKQIYLQALFYDSYYHSYILNLIPCTIDISAITDKLVDSKAGLATVKCSLKRTPTDYVQRLIQVSPAFVNEIARQNFEQEATFQFRRWDSGWRLEVEGGGPQQ